MTIKRRPQVAVAPARADNLALFSTCPPSNTFESGTEYCKHVVEVAQWSEKAGCTGILVYADNSLVDPWLVAQLIIQNTRYLSPLVAIQPIYMHPYSLAKKVASLGFLHNRKIYLNMVAGGFKNDLIALDDQTPHDRRYQRLTEYTTIIKRLLQDKDGVTFSGEFYRVQNLKLAPALPEQLQPVIFMSGSSEAGLAAAQAVGATAIHYPKPAGDYSAAESAVGTDAGIRIGIVCRAQEEEAWKIAHARFPEDRKGQLTHQMAMKVSDSQWHQQLSELAAHASGNNPYWLVPFENYKTMCPYLVGDYQRIGRELKRYIDLGYQTFILDVPGSLDELLHIRRAFDASGEVCYMQLLQQWADAAAQKRPEAVAVVDHDDTLSYGELSVISSQIAHALRDSGCQQGDRVCLLLPKSPMAIAALLGIYKADCIYVPLDVNNPVPRLLKILRGCDPRCILATRDGAGKLQQLLAQDGMRAALAVGWLDMQAPQHERAPQDFTLQDVFSCPTAAPPCRNGSTSPAHILFTSGSTGEPKGVVITHANVIAFVQWAVEHFGIGFGERLSGHSPLHFDLSMFDIFGAQAAGAELHLVGSDITLLPHKTAQWIRDSQLTQWFSVPSLMNYLCKFDALRQNDFPSLRRVLWCGEVLPTPVLQYWMQRLPRVPFTNLYGPTEATIASSYYTVPQCPADPRQNIPIGTACPGETLQVLDDWLQPVAPGKEGNLFIGGVGLAQGYWQDPARTSEVFMSLPDGGARVYKTGDRACFGNDGLVYYVGRNDQQIKSRGFRIDLGEIEAALGTLDYLREAAVVAVPDDSFGNVSICCAYVNPVELALTPVKLKSDLANLLPQYMIPSRWKALGKLPRNANGKIDRRKVQELFATDETVTRRQA